jgi:uncharacterized RDD family membrane protein YckC
MFCQHCGQQLPEATAYCSSCGKPIADTPPAAASPPSTSSLPAGAGTATPPPAAATPAQPMYAGFWLRVVAHIIDSFIIGTGMLVVFLILGIILGVGVAAVGEGNLENNPAIILLVVLFYLLMIVLPWLYAAFMESSSWQATVGKRALGLIVTDIKGQPISFWRATGRHFGKIVSKMTFFIGYAMAGFTEKKQALHDMIADCLVLRQS